MNPISEKLGLQPDILEGATIVKMFGTEYAIIENYKSLIEYTECLVKAYACGDRRGKTGD